MESKVCSSWPSSVILPSNFSQFGLILHEKLCFSTLFLPLFTWIKLCIMISGSSTMWYSNRPLIVYHHLDFKMIKSYHIPQQKTTQYATKTRSSIRLAPYIDIDSFYTISLVVGNSTFLWTFHPWGSDQNFDYSHIFSNGLVKTHQRVVKYESKKHTPPRTTQKLAVCFLVGNNCASTMRSEFQPPPLLETPTIDSPTFSGSMYFVAPEAVCFLGGIWRW